MSRGIVPLEIPYEQATEGEDLEGTMCDRLRIDGINCKLLSDGRLMYNGIECTPITAVREPVWDRQVDNDGDPEPAHWYRLFTNYRLLGAKRRLITLYRMDREERGENPNFYDGPNAKGTVQIIRAPGAWEAKAVRWRWRYRAEVWDAFVTHEVEERYINRQVELKEREWDQSTKLSKKVDQMLEFPLAHQVVHKQVEIDGKMVDQEIHYLPARWTLRDAAAFAKIASELARKSIGGDDESQRVLNIDVSTLTYEELERIANGEDPLRILADKTTS